MGLFDKKETAPVTHTVSLVKNQSVNLVKAAGPTGLGDCVVGCGWDASKRGKSFDLDLVAICLDQNGHLVDSNWFVYYGNLKAPGKVIKHSGDNLTGKGDGDDEQIEFDFPNIPPQVQRVLIAVNIYQSASKGQTFSNVQNAFVRVFDKKTGKELAYYNLGNNFGGYAIMIFGELYRDASGWNFRAVGEGTTQSELSSQYGVPTGF
jgi:tellurium resistance protein TerD